MWAALYDRHQQARNMDTLDVATLLRERLKVLVRLNHCDSRYLGKLSYKRHPVRGRSEIWVKGPKDSPLGAPIPLIGLPELDEAKLWLGAMLTNKGQRLAKFTVRLEGLTKSTGAPWLVSVELDEKHLGLGACGHAPIHCHVGPSHTARPEVRVPCPPMRPWDALDWVLTVVLPDWEPLPWVGSVGEVKGERVHSEATMDDDLLPKDLKVARYQWNKRWTTESP